VTASTLTFQGRLPGVDCNPALPAPRDRILLDVAAFVGFAERGPLDLPVPVEDVNQYEAVFGGDVVLATDAGVPVYANLPGAVRGFFDNGGRRCHVVRVAGNSASAARWSVPGLRLWRPDGVVEDVFVEAAWPGSWSAEYGVGTQLLTRPLAVTAPYRRAAGTPGQLTVVQDSLLTLSVGDVIRLDLGAAQRGLYVSVAALDRASGRITVDHEVAFDTVAGISPLPDQQLLLGPDAVQAMPDLLPVQAAWQLRMDLVAREVVAGASQLVERWGSLSFNPGGPLTSWLDVLQPVDDDTPDRSRSMLMRADKDSSDAVAGGGVFLPAGMDQLGSAAEFTGPGAGPSGETGVRAGDDGLASYDPVGLFLDPNLVGTTVSSVLTDADQLTTLSPHPIRLRGIHALIGVDEVALLSAPDAVHLTWSPPSPAPLPPPPPVVVPPPAPDWSEFRRCAPCTEPLAVQDPVAEPALDGPPLSAYPVLDDPLGYDPSLLVEVQTAMIQLCAARSDVVSVLSVPRHFDTAAVLGWLQALEDLSRESTSDRIVVAPLSFAGFWHPWVRLVEAVSPELSPLREEPADGTVCGMIAARELSRGVWVAPADVPLRGPVGLARTLSATDVRQLFDAHANLLRPAPGSIGCLSAHTLSADPTLLQISVRRLIILLRKIALLEGNRYVFEPNTDRFRQLVQLRFSRLLAALTRRGALAAYQVVTDGGLNTEQDQDQGRLIVELKIAPTSPIEFITITLVRAGEGLLDVVVG
jgi:hypothetical protein